MRKEIGPKPEFREAVRSTHDGLGNKWATDGGQTPLSIARQLGAPSFARDADNGPAIDWKNFIGREHLPDDPDEQSKYFEYYATRDNAWHRYRSDDAVNGYSGFSPFLTRL